MSRLLLAILLCLGLSGCYTYYRSYNACVLIPQPPVIKYPISLLRDEPELADWIIYLKEIRKLNHCDYEKETDPYKSLPIR